MLTYQEALLAAGGGRSYARPNVAGMGGVLYMQPGGGLRGGMGGVLYMQPGGGLGSFRPRPQRQRYMGLGYMSSTGQYGSAEVDSKKPEVSGVLDQLDSTLSSIGSTLANVKASLATAPGAIQASADYNTASSQLALMQNQSAAWRTAVNSIVSPPVRQDNYPISDRMWKQLDAIETAANKLGANAQALAQNVNALPQEVAAYQQKALSDAAAAAQATRDATAATNTANAQAAQLQYQSDQANALARAQADSAAADAKARADALTAQLAERGTEFQATQTFAQAQLTAQQAVLAAQQANQSQQDQAAMQLELARLQMEDAAQQRKDELQAARDQRDLTLALISKVPGLAPQLLPSLIPGLAPQGYAPQQAPMMQYGQACDPSVDPACASGAPGSMFSPQTQGPYAFTSPPPVVGPSGGGAGFDESPLSPGAEMFGMGGMGGRNPRARARRSTLPGMRGWGVGMGGLAGLVPAGAPLPAGSKIADGWSAQAVGNGGFTLVSGDASKWIAIDASQANGPSTVAGPDGTVVYQGPDSSFASQFTSISSALLPYAQTAASTYTQAQTLKTAQKMGQVPGTRPPASASNSGPSVGTVLGGIGIGLGLLWLGSKVMEAQRPAPAPVSRPRDWYGENEGARHGYNNPDRRRRRRRRARAA